jgi:A/G-specific adenine glycosylase
MIMQEFEGRFPPTARELRRLPGVGPYTARALLAFAFEQDAAVVDTNVARVLARVAGRRLTPGEVQAAADAALPAGQAWAWNQAMLDVGAARCRPMAPRCPSCPLAPGCAWHASGRADPDPALGSAGVSVGQSRFDGSDRQGRGRLVAALRQGPVAAARVPAVMGWPDDADRALRVAATVVVDGLAVQDGGCYRPP